MKDSLCWSCACSGASGCSWDRDFEPVEGWTATPTKIKLDKKTSIDSYRVIKCPEFRDMDLNGRDMDSAGGRPKFTDEELERLLRGGFNAKDIAKIMSVHINTVYHRKSLMDAKRRAKEHGNGGA